MDFSVLSSFWLLFSISTCQIYPERVNNPPIRTKVSSVKVHQPGKPDTGKPDTGKESKVYASASLTFFQSERGYLMCNENRSRRKNGPKDTPMVNTIGGKVEPGDETILDTAIREFEEETGIVIHNYKDTTLFDTIKCFDYCCSKQKQLYHRFYIVSVDPDIMPEISDAPELKHLSKDKNINCLQWVRSLDQIDSEYTHLVKVFFNELQTRQSPP